MSTQDIIVFSGLFLNFCAIVTLFVKLENRLTTLEVTLKLLTENFTVRTIRKAD
jgi:hypothetical protein